LPLHHVQQKKPERLFPRFLLDEPGHLALFDAPRLALLAGAGLLGVSAAALPAEGLHHGSQHLGVHVASFHPVQHKNPRNYSWGLGEEKTLPAVSAHQPAGVRDHAKHLLFGHVIPGDRRLHGMAGFPAVPLFMLVNAILAVPQPLSRPVLLVPAFVAGLYALHRLLLAPRAAA